jgi:hypothetical protein
MDADVSRSALVLLALLATTYAACRGKPRPTYEYEPPVTKVTGGVLVEDAPPAGTGTVTPTTLPPANPSTTTSTTLPPARPSMWRRGEKQ